MSEEKKSSPAGDLQFDKAVYKDNASGPSVCAACKSPLAGSYYQVNQSVTCPSCKTRLEKQFTSGSPAGRVIKALAFGIPAAILGAGLYYLIMDLTGYELGLVAIVIGWMVGAAVRKGSNYSGGLPYQIIAVVLTYMAICSTYIPSIIKGMEQSYTEESADPAMKPVTMKFELLTDYAEAADAPEPQAAQSAVAGVNPAPEEEVTLFQYALGFAVLFAFALAAPFLMGFSNIIGLLIIGFGVFEAWKMNKKAGLDIQGPFDVTSPVPG